MKSRRQSARDVTDGNASKKCRSRSVSFSPAAAEAAIGSAVQSIVLSARTLLRWTHSNETLGNLSRYFARSLCAGASAAELLLLERSVSMWTTRGSNGEDPFLEAWYLACLSRIWVRTVELGPKERPATYRRGSGRDDVLVSRCRTVSLLTALEST